ncbi:MAG TPA: thiamine ABC transporter substrate-binding protein [Alphaproteobacteria bacterium]|nr:thiamine ABC transporter substrate-binding protein [Alphaproteobacteria bacterium]
MFIPYNLKFIFSGLLRPLHGLAMTEREARHREELKRQSNPGLFIRRSLSTTQPTPRQKQSIIFNLLFLISTSSLYAKEILTVYTHSAFMSSSYGPGAHLKEAFEKTCDCEIQYVVLDTIPLVINRLNFEGERTKADVVLGLEDIGLDATHVNKLVPYASHCLAFVYNSQKIPCPPKTLDELINSSYPIILQDPRSSITGLGFLVWMKKAYGDKASQKWKTLAAHVLTFTKGWTEAYALFKQDIAPIVLSYTTDGLFNELEKEMPHLKALPFSEGHLCSNIYAGKLKTTQHPELVDHFLSFLLSPQAQRLIATHAWIYPKGDMPETWIKADNFFPQPFWISYTSADVKESQKAWIKEWVEGLIQ